MHDEPKRREAGADAVQPGDAPMRVGTTAAPDGHAGHAIGGATGAAAAGARALAAAAGPPELRPLPKRRARRTLRRVLLAGALAGGVGVALYAALRPGTVAVERASVTRGPMIVSIDQDGRTRVHDRFVVAAPLAGTLQRVTLHVGDSVAAGAVVARFVPLPAPLLDPRARAEAAARVRAAESARRGAAAAVAQARAAERFAAREASRAAELHAAGAVAARDVEAATLEATTRAEALARAVWAERVAAAELTMAQAALARFGASAADTIEVRAPVAGQVLRVLQESEGAVSAGTPILEIGDPATLEIIVDVLTADAVEIRPGAAVELERWGGAGVLEGRVRRVEPSAFTKRSALGVEEQRVNVIVELVSPRAEWAGLGDGFRVEARIQVWQAAEVLQVPSGAVFREGEGWAVYVIRDGRAVLVPITIGRRNASVVQVQTGLAPGDAVIVYPGDAVRDGVRVQARSA